jgi:tetratricopeptide (TPR) repeat protein
VVRRRIGLLPEPTAGLLQVSGVIGRDVDLALLAAASGRTIDEVADDIEPAVVHRLLADVPERPGTFRFSHALVREVVADDVSALRRARIHLAVADALEARADRDDVAEILAEHLWAAAPVGVGQRAAEAIERAAEVAVRRFAFEQAEALLARAIQLRRTSASSPGDAEAELLACSRLLSIQRSVHGYASVADSPHLRRAKELARRLDRPDILARLLWTEWAAYDTRCHFDRSDHIARQLFALSEDAPDAMAQVTGLASMGISHWHHGRLTEATALVDRAVAVGAALSGPVQSLGLDLEVLLLPHPFGVYLHVLTGDEDAASGEAAFRALAAAAPDRYAVSLVEMFAAAGALATGAPAWAERAARRGIGADPEATFSFWGRGLHAYLAAARIDQGHLDEGLAAIGPAIDAFTDVGGRTGVGVYRAIRAEGLAAAGRLDEAEAAVAEAFAELATYDEGFTEPLVLEADAWFHHARGDDPDEVRARFAKAVDLARDQGSGGIAGRVEATARRLGLT